jgi:hypothetical protein
MNSVTVLSFVGYFKIFSPSSIYKVEYSVFWDISPCGPAKVNGRFGGTCLPHLQGRRITRARNQC